MFIAEAESFRGEMLAKGHNLSSQLGQLVQLRLDTRLGILILNLQVSVMLRPFPSMFMKQ